MDLKKKASRSIAIALVGVSMITPIAYADTDNSEEVNTISMDISNAKVEEGLNSKEVKEELLNSNKYKTITTTETKKLKDGTTLEIESIEYAEKNTNKRARASVGTNFGKFSSIKFRDPLNYYKGTVSVNVQGRKTGTNTARINYIKYSNSGFNYGSRGAYGSKIVSTGNPARGMVNVHYAWNDIDASPQNTYTVILVNVYPSTNITIG